ncbi:MAG: hypothetical protein V3S67_07375, partial [Gammaproteobacteria bacterium]
MGAPALSLRVDPGWLFITAGLTLCVAGVLIPAQRSLHSLRGQLTRIEHLHTQGQDGIEAHEQFLDRLRHRDPSVIRRLAAAQLNLMPAGDTPVLVANSRQATVMEWIGRSVAPATVTAAPPASSWLTRLTGDTRRLWVIGFGVLLVFVGLLVDGREDQPGVITDVDWSDDTNEEVEGWDGNTGVDKDKEEADDREEDGEKEEGGEKE